MPCGWKAACLLNVNDGMDSTGIADLYNMNNRLCFSIPLFLLFFFCTTTTLCGQSNALFDEKRVAAIYITLPEDSLNYMIQNLVSTYYLHADFVFDDGQIRDTVPGVGLRLRGNTSLFSQKKSFKVSFNAFVPGREYQNVRKLNLLGAHNDPTMVREKLFYDTWKKAGMPERRTAFVKVYINGGYRGLYTNAEEIDKNWLKQVYGNNDGNLYKCTWPADLAYLGQDQQPYKNILNTPDTRAYDLTTNEAVDDYSHLVALITALNQPLDATFPDNIRQILDVNGVLKAYAVDVATGNWDDYFYNKNNYYLYDNPVSGRFEFTTYDTDNTFGVDWLNKDWAKRNCLAWQNSGEPRPMATKLLAVPEFHDRFVRYLDTLARFIVLPDSIFPHIDSLHQLITPAAVADLYRTLDYGYSIAAFHNGFIQTIDGHTPYGIKPFLAIRTDSIIRQIKDLLDATSSPTLQLLNVYPNPAVDWLFLKAPSAFSRFEITDLGGHSFGWFDGVSDHEIMRIPVNSLFPGLYFLKVQTGETVKVAIWVKGQ
jgi:hypothetical protein